MEIWKPIKNYEDLYEVSNIGRVKSLQHEIAQVDRYGNKTIHIYSEKIHKGYYDRTTGYRKIQLYKNGKPSMAYIHRLVAEAFCDNPNNYDIVDHKNGRKLDNRANNLRWVTQKTNIRNAIEHGHKYYSQKTTGVYEGITQSIECAELNKKFSTLREAAIYLKTYENLSAPWQTIKKNIHRSCKCGGTAYKYHWKFS